MSLGPIYENNEVSKVIMVCSDISEQKTAEANLKKSEEMWRSLVNNVPDYILLLDRFGKINYSNKKLDGLCNCVDSFHLVDYIHKSYQEEFNAKLSTVFVQSKIQSGTFKTDGKESNYSWVEYRMGPIKSDSGIEQVVVVISDISELRLKNEKLEQVHNQLILSEKMASLGVLTAGIAHEINNPVNYISAGVQALKHNLNPILTVTDELTNASLKSLKRKEIHKIEELKTELMYEESRESINHLIENITNGVDRTVEILDGLKVFSRTKENELIPTDLHQNLDATLIVLKNRYKNLATIHKSYTKHAKTVKANPGRLNQVFSNILLNAIDALEEKFSHNNMGKILIKTRINPDHRHVLVIISNNGIPIPNSQKNLIFDAFFTTKEPGKGTGLGLSLCQSIIQEHDGTIHIRSNRLRINEERDKYTSFIITIPLNL